MWVQRSLHSTEACDQEEACPRVGAGPGQVFGACFLKGGPWSICGRWAPGVRWPQRRLRVRLPAQLLLVHRLNCLQPRSTRRQSMALWPRLVSRGGQRDRSQYLLPTHAHEAGPPGLGLCTRKPHFPLPSAKAELVQLPPGGSQSQFLQWLSVLMASFFPT